MKIAVAGTGYVGLANALLLAQSNEVVAVDIIEEKIKSAGDKIVRLGYVDEKNIGMLYAAAKALIYPSLYEGFGLPVLEAMACGTPAICTNISSLPEVAGSAAILLDDPKDSTAIAGALC